MFFGSNTFGGVFAGLVLVSGAADSAATGTAHNEVTRLFSGQATSTATVSGYGLRQANNHPVTALASATLNTAFGRKNANTLPITAVASALLNTAKAQVDFAVFSYAEAFAYGNGASRRFVKLYPIRAQAFADGTAEAQIWQMGYANPAVGVATGFGTTYHLTYGSATGYATLYAAPRHQKGAHGEAIATCIAENNQRLYQIGAAGLGNCVAIGNGDPAYKRATVRYFEVNGLGDAFATAFAGTVGITQAQTGRCYATASGYAWYTIGGHGLATAFATGVGIGLGMGTAATAAPGDSEASVTGWASVRSNAAGQALAQASGSGAAISTQTRVQSAPTQAAASLSTPSGTKLLYGVGIAEANAVLQVLHVQRAVLLTPGLAFASLSSPAIQLAVYPAEVHAYGLTEGQGVRMKIGAGNTQGIATASGYNEINDLVPAPVERTVTVEVVDRLMIVTAENRVTLV